MPCLLPEAPNVLQLHAAAYKAPESLPDGAVLVIGTGASGAQIADELMRAGRKVYLSVSRHRRTPRRYRGHDHVWWWREIGLDRTPVDQRPSVSLPVIHTGAYGGYTMDFRNFARQGMVLLGRATAAHGTEMRFAPDLLDSLAHGDAAYLKFMDFVDAHVAAKGLDLPEDPAARMISPLPDGLSEPILTLDLQQAGISTVIWATGYGLDFGWIDLPVFETDGQPKHRLGVTDVPGLYFLGLNWLSKLSSSFLFGVGDDAEWLAERIAGRA
jgi:putative flavoprotein involved in K+ transport